LSVNEVTDVTQSFTLQTDVYVRHYTLLWCMLEMTMTMMMN